MLTDATSFSPDAGRAVYNRRAGLVLLVLLVWRTLALIVSPLDLGPDEAQYWRWGQDFDWGYYSKPPLIAWLIGSVTRVFGDTAWAVRLPAPFLHTLVGGLVFAIGQKMHDARMGFYALVIYALMPGVTFSSGLMTTDSVLFVPWTLSLLLLWYMRSGRRSWQMALALGLAIGAGFLAKYAMIYFVLGLALAVLIDAPTRQAFSVRNTLLTLLGALALLAPHIGWNISHELQTLSHTADNANWGGELFHPDHAIKFLVDQMGVFGPVSFLVLIGGIILTLRAKAQDRDAAARWLICFAAPALLVILVQAVTSRAHANWAATTYIAGSLLVARWMVSEHALARPVWFVGGGVLMIAAAFVPDLTFLARAGLGGVLGLVLIGFGATNGWRVRGLLWSGVALHMMAALVFTALAAGPMHWSETAGMANAFKRTRGWVETTQSLSDIANRHGARAIMVDERENWHGLDFYGRVEAALPVYTWRRYGTAKSYADLHTLPSGAAGPVLIASVRERFRPHICADFGRIVELEPLNIPLGGQHQRQFILYLGYDYQPLMRTADWDARFSGDQNQLDVC